MNQMTDAYAAGLLDGEGCVYVAHRNLRNFYARVDVGMSEKALPLLQRLRTTYGGRIRQTRQRSERWEAAKAWAVFGPEASAFLERVRPHLILKAEQADLVLGLQRMIAALPRRANGSANWTEEARAQALAVRALVMDLNRKGPTDAAMEGWIARYAGGQWLTPQRDMFSTVPWAPFSGTWPEAGFMRNGFVYPLAPWARHTCDDECSLWPTPTASMDGRGFGIPRHNRTGRYKQSTVSRVHALVGEHGWKIHPRFTEALMGFPSGWTEIEASETP